MPRFKSGELDNIETRLRSLERKMDKLYRQVNSTVVLPSIDDVNEISIGEDIYYRQSSLLYQTPKDGIEDSSQYGEDRYGHKVLSLNEDGTGTRTRVARVYYGDKYEIVETQVITWDVVNDEVVISDVR